MIKLSRILSGMTALLVMVTGVPANSVFPVTLTSPLIVNTPPGLNPKVCAQNGLPGNDPTHFWG